jgi:hypothetical protein
MTEHFWVKDLTRYHLCSRVGLLHGCYEREELEPQPYLKVVLIGINSKEYEGKITITALQVQEMHLKVVR